MYDYEINFVKNLNTDTTQRCLGVYTSDKIPLDIAVGQSVIANTDDSSKCGSHWIGININDPCTVEIFDSFGRPPCELGENIENYVSRFPVVLWNSERFQSDGTAVCGAYSLTYVWYKSLGMSLKEIQTAFLKIDNKERDRRFQKDIYDWRQYFLTEMLCGKRKN